jgi:hypothetical protein
MFGWKKWKVWPKQFPYLYRPRIVTARTEREAREKGALLWGKAVSEVVAALANG